MSMDELANVKGRGWEDIDVRVFTFVLIRFTDSNRSIDCACKLLAGSHLARRYREVGLLQVDACSNLFGVSRPVRRVGRAIPRCQIRLITEMGSVLFQNHMHLENSDYFQS